MKLETLIDGGAFFEGPRWHEGRLWVSDFWRYRVTAISLDGDAEVVAEVPGSPSGLGWLPDGSLLVVSMRDSRLLRVRDGRTTEHADLSAHVGGMANDMVVDASGRAYVGGIDFTTMGPTNLVRVDPDGAVTVVAEDMAFPNGAVITPDGSTLVVAESWAPRLTAFDIRPDGSLTGRRVWADFALPEGAPGQIAPDGIALDAEGALWVADAGGNRAVRVREGGEIVDEVGTGDLKLVACALGGEDGRTLFLCATPTYDQQEAETKQQARILTCQVNVPSRA
ncbi:SMP-30/gluconolactonase/LRE family protein [Nonomuraea sp. NPDC000554]|uniref:SMP-30/gluconolactonase/LRE family protein n=1 Tax=Nonomuraea sp. NPDC000554 TaxID=3154259 RepID=UPI00331B2C1E